MTHILMGDLNINFLTDSAAKSDLLDYLAYFGLTWLKSNEPTRIGRYQNTLLDVYIGNTRGVVEVEHAALSDHSLVKLNCEQIPLPAEKSKSNSNKKTRSWHLLNNPNLASIMNFKLAHELSKICTSSFCEKIIQVTNACIDEYIPQRNISERKTTPWFDSRAKAASKFKEKLFNTYKK